jgi:hypothetical protein
LRESQLKGRQTDDVSSKASGNIITFSRAKCYVGRKAKPGNVFFELVIEEINHHQFGHGSWVRAQRAYKINDLLGMIGPITSQKKGH